MSDATRKIILLFACVLLIFFCAFYFLEQKILLKYMIFISSFSKFFKNTKNMAQAYCLTLTLRGSMYQKLDFWTVSHRDID